MAEETGGFKDGLDFMNAMLALDPEIRKRGGRGAETFHLLGKKEGRLAVAKVAEVLVQLEKELGP